MSDSDAQINIPLLGISWLQSKTSNLIQGTFSPFISISKVSFDWRELNSYNSDRKCDSSRLPRLELEAKPLIKKQVAALPSLLSTANCVHICPDWHLLFREKVPVIFWHAGQS